MTPLARRSLTNLFLILVLADGTLTHAQAVCESIIRSANYNQAQSVNVDQRYSLQKANFCLSEYDKASQAQRAQIEASYGLFSGGASASASNITERQKAICESHYGEYWFSQLNFTDQKTVSDAAMDTVKACIEALAGGLRVEPMLSVNEDSVIISLNWSGFAPLKLNRIIKGNDSIKCKLDDFDSDDSRAKNLTLNPGTAKAVVCNRTKSAESISGEIVNCYRPTQIAIDSNAKVVPINLFRRCETDYLISKAKAIEVQVKSISDRLETQEKQRVSLDCRVDTAVSPFTRYPLVEAKVGAPGYSVVGGGCSVTGSEGSPPNPFGHNPPLTVNKPTTDGWLCRGADPPNIPENISVTASVVSCRTKTQ